MTWIFKVHFLRIAVHKNQLHKPQLALAVITKRKNADAALSAWAGRFMTSQVAYVLVSASLIYVVYEFC